MGEGHCTMGGMGLHYLLVGSGFRDPQSLIQNRGGDCIGYNRNMTIGVNRGFGLGDRNKIVTNLGSIRTRGIL
jgi:hypothetical protein